MANLPLEMVYHCMNFVTQTTHQGRGYDRVRYLAHHACRYSIFKNHWKACHNRSPTNIAPPSLNN
jgi:hypothetical protein